MDYSQAFRLKLRSFFAVLLLYSGRCYEAEICDIMLFLRRDFSMKSFFSRSQIFQFQAENHGL